MKCAVGGCNSNPTVVAAGLDYPRAIVLDGANVYWANAGRSTSDGSIMTTAK
jgi:hypothetical protein